MGELEGNLQLALRWYRWPRAVRGAVGGVTVDVDVVVEVLRSNGKRMGAELESCEEPLRRTDELKSTPLYDKIGQTETLTVTRCVRPTGGRRGGGSGLRGNPLNVALPPFPAAPI